MSKVIFSFEKIDTTMSCSNDELMKDICQKYANFIGKNIDSLRFSYEEKEINFQLSFEKLVNEKDKEKNEMKIFVYKNEDNQYRCPKCGEKIKFNKIDNITLSMNNLKDSFNGIKAAKAAGGFSIMVPDILQPDDEIRGMAGIVLKSLHDVKEYFENLK